MGQKLCFYGPARLYFTLSNIHCCLYFVIYFLAILDSIVNLKYWCIQISLLVHKPVYSVYTVWTSVSKMLALALVLATASQQLVPTTTPNLQEYAGTWMNKRQNGGSHHHHDTPAHLSARAPPTTPESASPHYTNNIFFERLKQHLSQRALARRHKKQWRWEESKMWSTEMCWLLVVGN